MIKYTDLPPDCIVRRACPTDKWKVINLLLFGVSINGNSILIATIFLFYGINFITLSGIFIISAFTNFNNWYLFSLGLIGVGTIPYYLWKSISEAMALFGMRTNSHFWLIESDGLVVGYGAISRHKTYSILRRLYIVPTRRAQGLGSFLLNYIIQENNKPLYLFCHPCLIGFYERFGFVSVSKKQLPLNIRFSLLPALRLNKFVNSPFSPTQIANVTDSLPPDFIVRQARKSDLAKICQLIFASSVLDFILPFGITSSLANSFMLTVSFIFPVCLLTIATVKILTNLQLLTVGLLAASMIAILLPIFILVFACLQMQKWRDFYFVESNGKLIAYARLSRHNQYCILPYLHLCLKSNLYQEQLANELLQYLVTQAGTPIYIACEAELVTFYKRFGFVKIATSNLPSSLQFGANINRRFGGENLVLR